MNTATPEDDNLYREAQRKVRRTKNYYNAIISYFAFCTFLTFLNWFQLGFTTDGNWWVGWVWFGWGISMFFYTVSHFRKGVFFGESWEQRKIQEELEKMRK